MGEKAKNPAFRVMRGRDQKAARFWGLLSVRRGREPFRCARTTGARGQLATHHFDVVGPAATRLARV